MCALLPQLHELPERDRLLAAVADGQPVWIVEGETDAISLAMLGFSVIGAPGASAKARVEWLEAVRGRWWTICASRRSIARTPRHSSVSVFR